MQVKWKPVVVVKLPLVREYQYFRPRPDHARPAFAAEAWVERILRQLDETHPGYRVIRVVMDGQTS